MTSSLHSLVFTVNRSKPELIAPAKPTPYEIKHLSYIDDQKGLRIQVPVINFYEKVAAMDGKDPVNTIRHAISKALVFYYPLAGRLREGDEEKLILECTGEGILFIEADADVRIEQFGDLLKPPFPGIENLLYKVPGSFGILYCPLLLIQVTRFSCGGFTVAYRFNHSMCDGTGLLQFMFAVAEIAQGASIPSVYPTWSRELLNARCPPQVSCVHHIYNELHYEKSLTMITNTSPIDRSFFFGPPQIALLMNYVPPHLRPCTSFELLTAFLWRCRTSSLNFDLNEEIMLSCPVNARARFNPPLPIGYYGNAFGFPAAVTTAGELCKNPIGYALELVKKLKTDVTDEFMRSSADLLVEKGRPHFAKELFFDKDFANERTYIVSDITHIRFRDVDFGWGKALFGGPAEVANWITYLIAAKGTEVCDDGIVVTINLPGLAMDKFAKEIDKTMKGLTDVSVGTSAKKFFARI